LSQKLTFGVGAQDLMTSSRNA